MSLRVKHGSNSISMGNVENEELEIRLFGEHGDSHDGDDSNAYSCGLTEVCKHSNRQI